MHRDMKADLQVTPAATLLAEQRACDRWRMEFNQVRPHEALKGKVPAEVYRPTERRRLRLSRFLYPSTWIVRTVGANGQIKIQDNWYTAGKALQGYRVALEPLTGLTHRLWFHDLDLGELELCIPNVVADQVVSRYLARRGVAA